MAKTLEELKEDLYTMFNQAKAAADSGAGYRCASSASTVQASAASIDAAAKAAQSIVLVEREIADRNNVTNKLDKLPAPQKPA